MEEAAAPVPSATPATTATPTPVPPLVGARQLIGASFDLLLHAGDPMRRASFYVGLIVLGTVGPVVLALWAMVVSLGLELGLDEQRLADAASSGWLALLIVLAMAGLFIASIESQAVAIAMLGSHQAGRPISVGQAVQRARMTFWWILAAALAIAIPLNVLQTIISEAMGGGGSEASLVVGLVVGIVVQAPFVYVAAGIVLGGVGPIESLRRSVRVFRARKAAGFLLAVLPTLFGLLLLFGVGAGLDVLVRIGEALGLNADSDIGVAAVTVLIVMAVFALGTLLYTAAGVIYAPQVVMFVGLTHATMGLEAVRPGGSHAVDGGGTGRFRWITRPLLAGFILGALGLAAFVTTIGS